VDKKKERWDTKGGEKKAGEHRKIKRAGNFKSAA